MPSSTPFPLCLFTSPHSPQALPLTGSVKAPMEPVHTADSIPWQWSSRPLLGALFPSENHSSFRFLGYLSLNTFPLRAPMDMWDPSNGKSSSRQWVLADSSTLHLAALDLSFLHSSCRGPQDPADFWKCHLPVSWWRGETQLWILSCSKSAGFSFHVIWRLLSVFSQKFSQTRNLELSQILRLSFWILRSTDEKGKGD